MLSLYWKDNRDVFVSKDKEVKRFGGEKVNKPEMVCDYNSNMGGVDKCDQYFSNYNIGRKTKKPWNKVFSEWLSFGWSMQCVSIFMRIQTMQR